MASKLLSGLLVLGALGLLGGGDEPLHGKTVAEWRALIEPSGQDLAFEAIPWRASFWSAVQEAQASERPILLWAMNGHPLGCT